jgi:hypothetical protein
VNGENVIIWKETVVTVVCLEKLRKTMETWVTVSVNPAMI